MKNLALYLTIIFIANLISCKEDFDAKKKSINDMTSKQMGTNAIAEGEETVVVDFGISEGEMTYRSSGLLKGLSSHSSSSPPDRLVTPIKAQFNRESKEGITIQRDRNNALGMTALFAISDGWGYSGSVWPGDNGDWTKFDAYLTTRYNEAISAGYDLNKIHFDIWNEANSKSFWNPAGIVNAPGPRDKILENRRRFCETYVHAVKKLRSLNPNVKIDGPGFADIYYKPLSDDISYPFMTQWIKEVRDNNAMPDFISWHFPGSSNRSSSPTATTPSQEIENVRNLFTSLGVTCPPIIISEFILIDTSINVHDQNPGKVAWLVSQNERSDILGACHAIWGLEGELDNMVYRDSLRQWYTMGEWWLWKKYGDITGVKVKTTNSQNIDLVAGKDADTKYSRMILGNRGGLAGTVTVQLKNVDKSFAQEGNQVFVKVTRIPYNNEDQINGVEDEVNADDLVDVLIGNYTVNNNQLNFTFDWGSNPRDAYAVQLGSGGKSITKEFEDLIIHSKSTDDHTIIDDVNFQKGKGVSLKANAVGDFVRYSLSSIDTGAYYVTLKAKKYNPRGVFTLFAYPENVNIGTRTDLYSATVEYKDINMGIWKIENAGDKSLRFTVAGKNPDSSGEFPFTLVFDYLKLTPVISN